MASNSWPVAKGGLFGQAERPAYSKETQDLLKVMMEESRLTNFQRRQLSESMKGGKSLPTRVAPTSSDVKKRSPPKMKPHRITVSSNMRTLDKIEQTGAYERPQFVPKPIRSLDKEKQRLANMMAYGEDIEKIPKRKIVRKIEPPPQKDRFEEIQEEIVERRQFLNEMEKLGQGKQHRSVINTQISQLIREMEVIDKHRTELLEKALDEQEEAEGGE
ncbi:UPF0193 protein EVG1 homolog [Styela clava]|uniref:UPF0193 protein EVG1 homolog n=1 Tax=Styela clava TaxID=7725 RepID=UPI001939C639|nr:UPF0193 protein EVG1 homolog [Styela clava]